MVQKGFNRYSFRAGMVLAIKLARTDTTLDLSHTGKWSWRRKESMEGRGGACLYSAQELSESLLITRQRLVQAVVE